MTAQEIENMEKLGKMIETLTTYLKDATQKLSVASQTITEKHSLIEHLSKDNLLLVAKLDQLTGRSKDFSA